MRFPLHCSVSLIQYQALFGLYGVHIRGYSEIKSLKKQLFLIPSPLPLSLLVTNISNPIPSHLPKSDKVFPDKLSAKVHSGFIILYVYYIIPQLNEET